MRMRCFTCRSVSLIKFVDGFGEKRIYCKNCGKSFLENDTLHNGQKKLLEYILKFRM